MPPDDRTWSPVVMSVLVFGVLLRITSIWLFCTFRWGEVSGWIEHIRPLGLSLFVALSLVNAGFLVLLGFELSQASRSAPSVRRGRLISVVLAAFVLVGLQLACMKLRDLDELERFMGMPPTIDEIHTEPISIHLSVRDSQLEVEFDIDVDNEGRARVRSDRRPHEELELPEDALERFRELLARGRYLEIDDSRPYLVDLQPQSTVRWVTVSVGLRSHEIVLFGRADGLQRWPSDAPSVEPDAETLRRILDTWDEVLSWFDRRHGMPYAMRRWEDKYRRPSESR